MLRLWVLFWQVTILFGQFPSSRDRPPGQSFPGDRQFERPTETIIRTLNSRPAFDINHHASYLILASRIVRPGSVYSVVLNMLEPTATTHIVASVSRDGTEIAAAETTITGVDMERILLRIPQTSIQGRYKLRVTGSSNDILGPQFQEVADLKFSPRFLTIVVNTNRPVYNADTVAFIRVIILNMDLKPFNEPVNIYILDPDNNVMAAFRSVQLNVGVGRIKYTIPRYPPTGWWTIQVATYTQVENYPVLVEKYYNPKYEVDVVTPEFLINTDTTLAGEIGAAYLAEGQIVGNITLRLYAQKAGANQKPILIEEELVPYFVGSHEFEYDLEQVRAQVPLEAGSQLKVEAIIHERFFGIIYPSFAITMIIDSKVVLQFLGPEAKVFKPGMPFRAYVAISFNDLAPLPEEKLEQATVTIQPIVTMVSGQVAQLDLIEGEIQGDGYIKIDLDMPLTAKFMVLKATYLDQDGDSAQSEIAVVSATNPIDNRAIHIYTAYSSADIGEYIIVHVQANFYIKDFHYLIASKGVIIHSAREEMELLRNPIKTISIPVSSGMTPSFEIIVYHLARDGLVFADSISIPINKFDRQKPRLIVNPYKDKTGSTVELGVIHIPGSFYGIAVRDANTFCHKCGADLTKGSVLENLFGFNESPDTISKMKWLHRGADPDQVLYYDTSNTAIDAPGTFRQSGIVVITDAQLRIADACNRSLGLLSCKENNQCFRSQQLCDGRRDCNNGFDEIGCLKPKIGLGVDLKLYRIYRRSRTEQFFDEEGDWGWIDFNTDDDDFFNPAVSVRPSEWFVTGFAMNSVLGLSLQDVPILYNGIRPFFMTIEVPDRCKSGEQVGVRVDVFNNQAFGMFATVVLKDSEDYVFIHVNKDGYVSSYSPQTSTGEHQHQIWIEPNDQQVVYMPIVFNKVGDIEVNVEVWTAIAKGTESATITVVPDGAKQRTHTSVMLDLKTHPQLIKYLDINVTESPIVPYQRSRLYVFGSPQAHTSLVGDVFGPVYPAEDIDTHLLLDKPFHSAEALAFTFGANVQMLHYLRMTNQLTKSMLHKSFEHMRYYYGNVMYYHNKDGSFSMFEDFEPSVWLTAYITKVLHMAVFSDWENFFYIDPNVISKAVEWLIKHQANDGSFFEISRRPLNTRMDRGNKNQFNPRHRSIPLTAFVLITLGEINDIPGPLRVQASSAKSQAIKFLEKQLHSLNDAYEIAITAYALTLVNSPEQGVAFAMLDKIKFDEEGKTYWSRHERRVSEYYIDNQRPLQLPRLPYLDDALSVEATSYALLVYIAKEGLYQENMVRFLNSMRSTDGGFISTQDTLIAMQALTEFTFRARIRDVTDMRITLRSTSNPKQEDTLKINPRNLAELQIMELPKVWGHIDILARGAGYAISQLDVSYSVDLPERLIRPPVQAFELDVLARYGGKNNSHISIRACQRWLLTNHSSHSGVAVFELDVPTGYYQDKPQFFEYVRSKKVPNLRRMSVDNRKIYAYFDYLDNRTTCIDFTVQRWFPVANLSQYNLARLYEYHSPEHYTEKIFHGYTTYVMDICQVCGSYQCPYCPYFTGSYGVTFTPSLLLLFIMLLVSVYHLDLLQSLSSDVKSSRRKMAPGAIMK